MTITTRQTSSEGVVNKDATLTNEELDNNFVELAAVKNQIVALSEANSGDQVALTTPNTPAGNIAATNVQAAINELDTEKAPLDSPIFTGTVAGVTKAMVGLGNVDNTSDASKPVSTAQAAAIAAVVYTHPANHAPSVISQDASNRFVTDAEKATWNGKQAELVSGVSIKTVGGVSLLGSGDVPAGGGSTESGFEQTFLLMGA